MKGLSQWHWFLLLALMVTGSFIWISSDVTNDFKQHPLLFLFLQTGVVLHIVVGLLSLLICVRDYWHHTRQTLGFRRPGVMITGLGAVLLAISLYGSGIWIYLFGKAQYQSQYQWIDDLHFWSALLFVSVIAIHIALHVIFRPKSRRHQPALPSLSISKKYTVISSAIFISSCILIFAALQTKTQLKSAPWHSVNSQHQYTLPYGENPFAPSETQVNTSHGPFVQEHEIADSATCGGCHQDIFQQWQASIHRHSASDPAYVTNIISNRTPNLNFSRKI